MTKSRASTEGAAVEAVTAPATEPKEADPSAPATQEAKPPAMTPTGSPAPQDVPSAAPTSRAYYTQAKIERAGFEAEIARLELQKADIEDAFNLDMHKLTVQRNEAVAAVQRVINDTQISLGMAMDKCIAYERNVTQGSA